MKIYMTYKGVETITTDEEVARRIIAAIQDWDDDISCSELENISRFDLVERLWILKQYAHWLVPEGPKTRFSTTKDEPVFESDRTRRETLVREGYIARILGALGDQDVVCKLGYYDEENGRCISTHQTTLREMLEQIFESDWSYKHGRRSCTTGPSVLRSLKTLKDVFNTYVDSECDDLCMIFVGTQAEYENNQREERRKELEGLASQIARKHNVKVNSLEFLAALDKEARAISYQREEWNNPEVRMEEWAACRYAGVGYDVYFDDLNYVNGKLSSSSQDLYDIEEWISQACPLLYAQYEEQRLARAGDDDDEDEEEYHHNVG